MLLFKLDAIQLQPYLYYYISTFMLTLILYYDAFVYEQLNAELSGKYHTQRVFFIFFIIINI